MLRCRSRGSAALFGNEVGDRAACLHSCPARAAGARRRSDKAASDQILEWILAVERRQPRDRVATAGNRDLGALLNALEMLAQPIVKLTHPHFIATM